MRLYVPIIAAAVCIAIALGCGSKTTQPVVVKIVDGKRYFPIKQGNYWYYNATMVLRKIDGDTTINGVKCFRLLTNSETDEAWTLTDERFAQHLLLGFLWFDPPLDIPLNLEKNKAHHVSSLGRVVPGFESDADSARFSGDVSFRDFVVIPLGDTTLDSCIALHYKIESRVYRKSGQTDVDTSVYNEYYAKYLGLIRTVSEPPSTDDLDLDFAVIDSVTIP